jgi:predicted acyltransferase
MKQLPKRLLSIDVLRALTMLLMIFVNDASGVNHIPSWLDHAKEYEDGMGFADTIFPCFLFIVGLSIPLAINNRISKGDTIKQLFIYILLRSAALIIMGFYHVNLEEYNSAAVLPKAVWEIIITLSFFLIWLDYPDTMARAKKYVLQGIGLAALLAMAFLYSKSSTGEHLRIMHPSWWGILGIIGWSYIVCAILYVLVKGKLNMLIVVWIIFAALNILFHTVWHGGVFLIGDADSVALTMGGIVITNLYAHLVKIEKTQRMWLLFAILGAGLIIAGLLIRPYAQGISKIRSTPAWVFICSGITILMFEFFIYLVDIKGKINWFRIIRPAGTSTLTCYLIPYLQVSLFELLHVRYPSFFNSGMGGLIRSMATGLIIIALVGLMEKKRLRLKV